MKAHLVYIDLLVRVELPDNATEEEIQDAGADKALQEARQDGGFSWMRENISDWKEDTERPVEPDDNIGDPDERQENEDFARDTDQYN